MERGPSTHNYLQGNKKTLFRFFAGNSRRRLLQAVFLHTPTPKGSQFSIGRCERTKVSGLVFFELVLILLGSRLFSAQKICYERGGVVDFR